MSDPPPKSSQLIPGYRLDRYELLCPIAEGGMASVWVARMRGKHGFEKFVAIKTILPKFASDARFEQMFLDEARLASRIEHTNVAHIMDLGEEHDVLYLVMEWVDGDSLSKLSRASLKKGIAVPPGIVLRIVTDTCGGLHAAHELRGEDGEPLGVVHRDVSPQNILVNTRGVAKLIDFGIAKARDRMSEDTNAGLLKGKISYMAPEQALGKKIDRRADVWAIGAILYHLLSGKLPYEAENQLGTLHLLTSGRPPLPLPATVHPAVAAVIKRALTHDVDKRFASAAEMQAALEVAIVKAGVTTTTADVAAFAELHLAERAKHRKQALDLALAAAAERARVAQIMKMKTGESATGMSTEMTRASLTPTGQRTQTGGSSPGYEVASSVEPSSATLGSAALASPVPAWDGRRRKGALVVAGAGVAVIACVVFVTLAVRGGGPATGSRSTGSTTTRTPASSATMSATAMTPLPSDESVPTISASELPKVMPSAVPHPRTPIVRPPSNPTPAASTAPPKKRRIDDGF